MKAAFRRHFNWKECSRGEGREKGKEGSRFSDDKK
jgi:hypothetical protein